MLQGHSVFREMTVAENVLLGAYTVKDKAVIDERVDFVKTLFPVVAERWDAAGRRCCPAASRSRSSSPAR